MTRRSRRRTMLALAGGLGAGLLVGLAALATIPALALDEPPVSIPESLPKLDATHLPPLLYEPDEKVTLRFDINCAPLTAGGDVCAGSGTVFFHPGQSGTYSHLPLKLDPQRSEGRYYAEVPATVSSAADGFSYYAVLRDGTSGATMTLPAGGAAAPYRSLPLTHPTTIALGSHQFGSPRPPDEEVVRASWGDGPDQVGLEVGTEETPIGASSFDVTASGTIYLLDEAHKRALRWSPGEATPTSLPLSISGTVADMAVAGESSIYVLEDANTASSQPTVKVFAQKGKPVALAHTRERTATAIALAQGGPRVLSYPSSQWMPIFSQARPLSPRAQATRGEISLATTKGTELVVLERGSEIRIAQVDNGTVTRCWRVTSETALGEIQLAKQLGDGLLLVAHPYDETSDEFLALSIGPEGLRQSFSLASSSWAETAPLSRFRLVGSQLYQLGSDRDGAFVNRFQIGGES
jgi:hypothetical protein